MYAKSHSISIIFKKAQFGYVVMNVVTSIRIKKSKLKSLSNDVDLTASSELGAIESTCILNSKGDYYESIPRQRA